MSSSSSPSSSSICNVKFLLFLVICLSVILSLIYCSSTSSSSISNTSIAIKTSSVSQQQETKITEQFSPSPSSSSSKQQPDDGSKKNEEQSFTFQENKKVNDDDNTATLYKTIRDPSTDYRYYLPPLQSSCNYPYGSPRCVSSTSSSSSSSSPCCCCCWQPIAQSCVGNFRQTPANVLKSQIGRTGFIKLGQYTRAACPWFDRGTWSKPLPENFASLSSEAVRSSIQDSICPCQKQNNTSNNDKHSNRNKSALYGLAYLHELIQSTVKNNNHAHPYMQPFTDTTAEGDVDKNGIFIIAGDSMSRQLFARMILRIRSRECSSEAEMRRRGAFEMQMHDVAVYIAGTEGDAFSVAQNCQVGIRLLMRRLTFDHHHRHNNYRSTQQQQGNSNSNHNNSNNSHRVLFKACFIWDSSRDGSSTVNEIKSIYSEHIRSARNDAMISTQPFTVSSIVFFPQVWYCAGYYVKRHLCMVSNQSNGVALSVIGTAAMFSIPKVVIATTMTHQKISYFQVAKVKERNAQLTSLFPFRVDPRIPWIRTMMKPVSMKDLEEPSEKEDWKIFDDQQQQQRDKADEESNNNAIPRSDFYKEERRSTEREFKRSVLEPFRAGTTRKKGENINDDSESDHHHHHYYWSKNVRLYDYNSRHAGLKPSQCDNVHSLCTFVPPRTLADSRNRNNNNSVLGLFGGNLCPGPGESCQDLVNYVLLDDMLRAINS